MTESEFRRPKISFDDWKILMQELFLAQEDDEMYNITLRILYLYCFDEASSDNPCKKISDEFCNAYINNILKSWKKRSIKK